MSDYGFLCNGPDGKVHLDPSFNNLKIIEDITFTKNTTWSITHDLIGTESLFFFLKNPIGFDQGTMVDNRYVRNTYSISGKTLTVSIQTASAYTTRLIVGVYYG